VWGSTLACVYFLCAVGEEFGLAVRGLIRVGLSGSECPALPPYGPNAVAPVKWGRMKVERAPHGGTTEYDTKEGK